MSALVIYRKSTFQTVVGVQMAVMPERLRHSFEREDKLRDLLPFAFLYDTLRATGFPQTWDSELRPLQVAARETGAAKRR
jgi:hypothetical protein